MQAVWRGSRSTRTTLGLVNHTSEPRREKLRKVLAALDQGSRETRAARVEWLSLYEPHTLTAIMGRVETLELLREARAVFVDGHFIACLLLAMSFIEHTLIEELQDYGHTKGSPTFSQALDLAEKHRLFPAEWLARAKKLSLRRNPFVHIKDGEHEHGLGRRIRTEKRHPKLIIEADAKDSISLMYNFFVATLKEANSSADEASLKKHHPTN